MKHSRINSNPTIENFKALENKLLQEMNDGTLIGGITPDFHKLVVDADKYKDIVHFPKEGIFCMGGVAVEVGHMYDRETAKPVNVIKITSKRIKENLQNCLV